MARPKSTRKPISLQERDFVLLKGLFETRLMTSAHAAAIYFEGRKEAAKKRLQKLKAAGFIGERARRAYEPSILFLSKEGLLLLRSHGILAEYPLFDLPVLIKRSRVSEQTVRHELAVMDVKAAFHTALTAHGRFSIAEFGTWPRLYEFEATYRTDGSISLIKPDGFVRIHEKEADGGVSEHSFFLEVDRSNETLETLVAKAAAYLDYYKSGSFAEKNGGTRSSFKEYPFRVLMVLKSAERRNNVAERLLASNPPIMSLVCLSTIADATTKPLGPSWVRPVDYRHAVAGTTFDPETRSVQSGYQRVIAREQIVETRIKKSHILASDN